MPTKKERIALHEAGHAIAARALGASIEEVVAFADGGHVTFSGLSPRETGVVLAAGIAAEKLAYGGHGRRGCQRDLKGLRALSKSAVPVTSPTSTQFARTEWIRGRIREAAALLRSEWPSVQHVAKALWTDGHLLGQDMDAMKRSAGVRTSEEYAATRKRFMPSTKGVPETPEAWMQMQLERRENYIAALQEKCREGTRSACEATNLHSHANYQTP